MNIFKANGQIDTGIDPQTIPADRRGAFVALVTAAAAAEQAESNEKATDKKVADCVRAHDAAMARIPKQTVTALVKECFNLV